MLFQVAFLNIFVKFSDDTVPEMSKKNHSDQITIKVWWHTIHSDGNIAGHLKRTRKCYLDDMSVKCVVCQFVYEVSKKDEKSFYPMQFITVQMYLTFVDSLLKAEEF